VYRKRKLEEKPIHWIRHRQVPRRFSKIALSFTHRIPLTLKQIKNVGAKLELEGGLQF
jgi:hypothetical protein